MDVSIRLTAPTRDDTEEARETTLVVDAQLQGETITTHPPSSRAQNAPVNLNDLVQQQVQL